MKENEKRALELKIKLDDIFKQYDERTKYILSHPELIEKVNYRKNLITLWLIRMVSKSLFVKMAFFFVENVNTKEIIGHEIPMVTKSWII